MVSYDSTFEWSGSILTLLKLPRRPRRSPPLPAPPPPSPPPNPSRRPLPLRRRRPFRRPCRRRPTCRHRLPRHGSRRSALDSRLSSLGWLRAVQEQVSASSGCCSSLSPPQRIRVRAFVWCATTGVKLDTFCMHYALCLQKVSFVRGKVLFCPLLYYPSLINDTRVSRGPRIVIDTDRSVNFPVVFRN